MRTRATRSPATSKRLASPGARSVRPKRRALLGGGVAEVESDMAHSDPLGQCVADQRPGAGQGHLLGDALEEARHDQLLGSLRFDATRLEVVALVFVHRADRGGMAALHVVLIHI